MSLPNFFVLIIGTEILNKRRRDKHFDYVTSSLTKRGYKLTGSFIIEDDPALIVQSIKFIASQPNPVLLSFGGIGSTPDDHTRKCAAIALRDGTLPVHEEAKQIIIDQLGEKAYPYSVRMAELPKGSKLMDNPVNKMPAFSLDERYFFMPGFPEMSHPMVEEILNRLIPNKQTYFRHTLTASCKENLFIEVMEKMPKEVEFSSLPKLYSDGWKVSISVASYDETMAQKAFEMYTKLLDEKAIDYTLEDESND
ncbi:molybdopterin-binding protein [Sulfurovum sp. zt1-1]|uniref:Molybdopterin-binding protein n=1 Tax=Sulfurovum zhangzhouensis TaxID=3019067 RepID=A0ABT7QW48_9BACT|nr:molybdopterin-binding protein [Sulfurovum zhangzhouensis]MDM5271058.1 molybdopterin-binding protein [Sulfurovum zhangzhouensis]